MTILIAAPEGFDIDETSAAVTLPELREVDYTQTVFRHQVIRESVTPSGFVKDFAEPAGVLYTHFFFHQTGIVNGSTSQDGRWCSFYAANGDLLARINANNGVWEAQAFGDGVGTSGAPFTTDNNLHSAVDLVLDVNSTEITFTVVIGGLIVSTTTTPNTQNLGKPTKFAAEHVDIYSGFSVIYFSYSQLLITDGEPTVGWKLSSLGAEADGAATDWLGGFEDVSDGNSATRIASSVPGDRSTFIPRAYAGAASPSSIRAVILLSRAYATANGPGSLEHSVRIGGTDYDSGSPVAVSELGSTVTHVYDVNPATGLVWDTADLAAFEFGPIPRA